jgi:hypothetical protein
MLGGIRLREEFRAAQSTREFDEAARKTLNNKSAPAPSRKSSGGAVGLKRRAPDQTTNAKRTQVTSGSSAAIITARFIGALTFVRAAHSISCSLVALMHSSKAAI